jgi:hypothetical protein
MSRFTRFRLPSIMVVLALSGVATACSSDGAPSTGPSPVVREASRVADSLVGKPRGVGGQVANPRAQLQAAFRKRPQFAAECQSLAQGSSRMAALVGCEGLDLDAARTAVVDGEFTPEMLELIAEMDALVAELELAWNPPAYLVDCGPGALASTTNPCSGLFWTAMGATARATLDVMAFGWGVRTANAGLMSSAAAAARISIPATIAAVGTYMSCDSGGGGGAGRRPN